VKPRNGREADRLACWRGTLVTVERLPPDIVRVRRERGVLFWRRTETLDYRVVGERFVHVESGVVLQLAPRGVWEALCIAAGDPL
jgi:hypothetical protein